jgi:hypothetical protein
MKRCLEGFHPETVAAFKRAYIDFVVRAVDRTEADLSLLEREGLMWSRTLKDDDDFFGMDSLEPGELCFEFTSEGRDLIEQVEQEYAVDIHSWATP